MSLSVVFILVASLRSSRDFAREKRASVLFWYTSGEAVRGLVKSLIPSGLRQWLCRNPASYAGYLVAKNVAIDSC